LIPSATSESPPTLGPPDALGQQAASGLLWMTTQTIFTKALVVVSQIILAWKLQEKDFALVALAFAAAAFPSLVQQIGVREVLIQRHREFEALANPATWLSLTIGLLTALAIAVAGPIAAQIYDEPKLIGLVLVLALTAPFTTLLQIPMVALQIQMRHRTVAMSGLVAAVANPLLSMVFAYAGFGAYSFVLPVLITTILRVILLWSAAKVGVRLPLRIALWPQIVGGGVFIFVAWAFGQIIGQGDYLTIGWIYEDKRILGIYYFAFNLSLQTLVLLGPNLDGVLLPTLSKLQNQPDRQREVFLLISRAIAFFAFPLCFLQAALAGPIIRIFFPDKWIPAIPVLAILSVGMSFRTAGWVAHSLFPAQGRYRMFALVHVWGAIVFMILVFVAAKVGKHYGGGAVAVAIAVSIYFALEGPAKVLLAMRPMNGTWRDAVRIFVPPMILSGIAISLAYFLGRALPELPFKDWMQLGLVTVFGGGIFLLAAKQLMPKMWSSIWDRAVALLRVRPT